VSEVGSERGEFAVLVGEPWQGKGLGNLLTQYCVKHSERVQVREIYGITGRTNTRMLRVFRRYGFDLGPESDPTLLLATRKVT
jgi:acetyltransferase